MKGYRFYAEMPAARKSKSASKANPFFPWNVKALNERAKQGFRCDLVAVYLAENGRPYWGRASGGDSDCMDSMTTAIEGNPLSYCGAMVSRDYLRNRCTRIPENLARQLAPALFSRLES